MRIFWPVYHIPSIGIWYVSDTFLSTKKHLSIGEIRSLFMNAEEGLIPLSQAFLAQYVLS